MKLSRDDILTNPEWGEKGYVLPKFDMAKTEKATVSEPRWLHFGAGNLFRAFPAVIQQELLERGLTDKGIIVCEAFDEGIIDGVYTPFGNTHIVVTLNADGSSHKRVTASVAEAFAASANYDRLKEICVSPGLGIISFTVTEKGYQNRAITELVARLCRERYASGRLPVALLSLDNCSKNGDVLKNAVLEAAEGFNDAGFIEYLNEPEKVSFPWSMIDKITPRPSESVQRALREDGLPEKDTEIIKTAGNTFAASFVNTEPTQYLAIEDRFPNGRPPLEEAGVIFCDRGTVHNIESMKVRTALNPLHTAMSIFARLLGYGYIYEAMKDDRIKRFITRLGYGELMPAAVNPGVIDPLKFMDEVINKRFPNPCIPDTPQRILCDTSQKIPVRFGETLKVYAEKDRAALSGLTLVPFTFAGWLRYLKGTDDKNRPMELSPDPLLNELTGAVGRGEFKNILARADIFGIDLCEYGLAAKVTEMFGGMAREGAVGAALEKFSED